MTPFVVLVSLVALLASSQVASAKSAGSVFTAERRRSARRNIERYAWAAEMRDSIVGAADHWAQKNDEELWRMVPEQALPRTIHVSQLHGCPNCGDAVHRHGNYPWEIDVEERPWKLRCPSCREVYPKNDFGAFYESAKGPGYLFDRERGDKSLLFNAEHPNPADPLRTFAVDDGYGFTDAQRRRYDFIAYYCHWGLWRAVQNALGALSTAYVYTEEPRYAHKAAVLLDRIADVYPAMDYLPLHKLGFWNSHGGSGMGRIHGRIWETGTGSNLVLGYDRVYDGLDGDAQLVAFLQRQQARYAIPGDKTSIAAIKAHIECDIVFEVVKGIKDRRIRGNEGMHQAAMARAAVVLDDPQQTPELLDWIFGSGEEGGLAQGDLVAGGNVPAVLVNKVDRDGVGSEASPSYSLGWLSNMKEAADIIAEYGKYTARDFYRDYPKFRQMFTAPLRMAALNRWTPNIGDCGSTGRNGRVGWSLPLFVDGFRRLGDPRLAQAIMILTGGDLEAVHGSIFDAEPEAIRDEIRAAALAVPDEFVSDNMAGYGLTLLQSGREGTGRALWLYYGRNTGHGHLDRLNIGLFAKGLNLLPDLGYPEYTGAWPQRIGWTNHTASHNTVLVDRSPQAGSWVGQPKLFKALPGVKVIEVASEDVYPQCDLYRRQAAFIDVSDDDSYAVDIFRVHGGGEHHYSFHAAEGEPTAIGLALGEPEPGTLAGPDVALGQFFDGPTNWSYRGSGFMYLYDVRRARPAARFALDWPIVDTWRLHGDAKRDVHLRLTMLDAPGEIVVAHGDPPQNKPGNPRRLAYMLARGPGAGEASQFIALIEPYEGRPLIEAVERLAVAEPQEPFAGITPVALRVTLSSGATDYVLSSVDPDRARRVPDLGGFAATFAWARLRGGTLEAACLMNGTRLLVSDFELTAEAAAYTGVVRDMDRQMDAANCIYTDAPLPTDGSLVGESVLIATDGVRNGCYVIRDVRRDAGRTVISLGDVTFIRSFKDNRDFEAGFVYNFEPGAAFTIPTHVWLQRRADGSFVADASVPFRVRLPRGSRLEHRPDSAKGATGS